MVKVFVEGGGDSNDLKTACRKGFRTFFENAGIKRPHQPTIVACGGRQNAFEDFCTALRNGDDAFLLVDSEESVATALQPKDAEGRDDLDKWLPWIHLAQRRGDGWVKPANATDLQCHLMAECMESWFLADREELTIFFGQGFESNRLPAVGNAVESIPKQTVYSSLAKATAHCKKKAQYGKGEHSFKLLAAIDANKVIKASPWAKRLVDELKKMGA